MDADQWDAVLFCCKQNENMAFDCEFEITIVNSLLKQV